MVIDINSALCSTLMPNSYINTKSQVVEFLLKDTQQNLNDLVNKVGAGFAPSNIALCKYWGKRSLELNLPTNSSLSISLGNNGTFTKICLINSNVDQVVFNNQKVLRQSDFYIKIVKFLDLFRNQLPEQNLAFSVDTYSNLPTSAGLASSASGFAALVKALDQLFSWNLSVKQLSILSRLGSGSACRSLFHGFVKWHNGALPDGMDSFGEMLDVAWPDFCIGLLILDNQEKYLSSREAMLRSVETSPLYNMWPELALKDLNDLENAIQAKNFSLLGQTAESNALAMHAVMSSARPAIIYSTADTLASIKEIWQLRQKYGIELYFTQDAGPNLKLLFLEQDAIAVKKFFPNVEIIRPFSLSLTTTPFPVKGVDLLRGHQAYE